DSGLTWTQAQITGLPSPIASLHRITLATSGALGYAEVNSSAGLAPGLIKSTDSGHSWRFVPATGLSYFSILGNPPSGSDQGFYNQVVAIDPDNAQNVWLGGVFFYRSLDGGSTWLP